MAWFILIKLSTGLICLLTNWSLRCTHHELVDWWFARQQGYELGTVVEGDASISTPSKVDRLITDEERYVQITQDGIVISNWRVVHPKDISSRTERITEDMCAMVGDNIVFSRAFRDTESNGLIVGDVITKLTRLTSGDAPNVKLLTEVKPKLLLILGVSNKRYATRYCSRWTIT